MASPSLPGTAAGSVTERRELDEMRERVRARGRSVAVVVDALGGEMRHATDWRTHAARHPLWALGTAAGVGLLAATLVRRRPAPEARLLAATTSSLEALAGRLRAPSSSRTRASRGGAARVIHSVVAVWAGRALRRRLVARAARAGMARASTTS